MTAPVMTYEAVPAGVDCARCDTPLVITKDAIGRERVRCPRCDGISRKRPSHPDDAMMPQALVPVMPPLPPIEEGQLRCQLCARGIPDTLRFCSPCRAKRKRWTGANSRRRRLANGGSFSERACRGSCGTSFTPTMEHRYYCPVCAALPEFAIDGRGVRAVVRKDPMRPCLTCGAPTPRTVGRPRKGCEACR